MSLDEKRLIAFVTSIPSTTNPYFAVSERLKTLFELPIVSQLSRKVHVAAICLFGVMLLQALYLLIKRIESGRFGTIKFNPLGLLVVDISDFSAIMWCIYVPLTIVDMCMMLESHVMDCATILLTGYKYLVLFTASWYFLWVCVCQCACLKWDSPLRAQGRFSREIVIVKWGVICCFLAASLFPIPGVLWSFAVASHESIAMRLIVLETQKSLEVSARGYVPTTYKSLELLAMLLRLRELTPRLANLERNIKIGLQFYLSGLVLLMLIYVPSLSYALNGLYKQATFQKRLEIGLGREKGASLSGASRKLRRQRNHLIYHFLIVYCSTVLHMPPLIWQLANVPPGFVQNRRWQGVLTLGLNGPLSITGNVILLNLILNERKSALKRNSSAERTITAQSMEKTP